MAGFDTPGRIDELTPSGKVVWTYGPTSGPGSLDRPSLAVRWPNGMIAATDDWHHRIIVIDPHTKRIVWQYGHFGVASSALGYLSKPDGLDLLPAGRPLIRPRAARSRLHITRIGSLPPGGLTHVGGRAAGRTDFRGGRAGRRPALPHRCSPVALGHSPGSARCPRRSTMPQRPGSAAYVYVFGGGQSSSTDRISRIDTRTWTTRPAGSIGEPLSDLGAASVGKTVYLVGGYTGRQYATAILAFRPSNHAPVAARLPQGLRYAGVAALGGKVYVAGGLTTAGESRSVYVFDPRPRAVRRIATLPKPLRTRRSPWPTEPST